MSNAIADVDLILQRAYRWARETPDRTYLTQPFGGDRVEEYSWSTVIDQARRMARHLQSLGLPTGSNIAILSKNCAHFVMTDLAIWMAGFTSVALYPTLNAETVAYILEHSESKLLFVGKLDTWDQMRPGVPADMPRIRYELSPPEDCDAWDDIVGRTEPIDGHPTRDGEDLALIIYTSGSTGRPKGVMHNFEGMSIACRGLQRALNTTRDERILSYLPMAHAMERWLVECGSLWTGCYIFFAESLDTFAHDLRRAHPTLFISVPRLWMKFQLAVNKKMPPKKLNRLLKIPIVRGIVRKKILTTLGLDAARFAGSGSAPIPAELIDWYRALGLELLEGYGMSENFCYSHVSMPGRTRVGYVGEPYPEVECRISDAGEILVKSPASMLGYYKQPELSAESFTEDGFLKTGDRGEIDSQGRLRITGRVKELFKTSKGKYIAPAPIENLLNTNDNVELSVVTGSGRPAAHAVVLLAEDLVPQLSDTSVRAQVEKDLSALLQSVNKRVDHHEHLQFIAIAPDRWSVESGHLTPTMKIRRSALEDTHGPLADDWYSSGKKVIWPANA